MDVGITDNFSGYVFQENELNEENAHRVKVVSQHLAANSVLSTALGIFGTVLSSLEIVRRVYFTGVVVFPLAPSIVLISSLAFVALGITLRVLANRQFNSFPEKKRAQLAFEALKKQILTWPVFADEKSLAAYCKVHPDFGYQQIADRLNVVNYTYDLVGVLYDPIKNPCPHLRVHSILLNENEINELLFLGFQRGLIIHFTHLEENRPSGKDYPFAAYYYECKEVLDRGEALPTFEASKKLSLVFLENILKLFKEKSLPIPTERIQMQLYALAPKINRGLNVDSFKPLVSFDGYQINELDITAYFHENDKNGVRENKTPRINPLSYYQRFYHWIKG